MSAIMIDGQQTIIVPCSYTPLTLLAIAGMTDTRLAVHVNPMQPTCDYTADGAHPLSRGSVPTSYDVWDANGKGLSVVTIVCVACGRFGNTEAKNMPGSSSIRQ